MRPCRTVGAVPVVSLVTLLIVPASAPRSAAGAPISFRAPFYGLAAGQTSRGVAVGDLDADGRLDVATTDYPGVVVTRRTASGGYAAPQTLPTPAFPYTVAFGDIDGDADLDVVATSNASGRIWLMRGHGDGTFDAWVEYVSSFGSQRAILVADLDNDGRGDVVVGNSGSAVNIFPGLANGTLGTRVDLPYSTFATLAVEDVNADGDLDLLVGDAANGVHRVLLGHGDLTFTSSFTLPTQVLATWSIGQSTLGDVDGDGAVDLVFAASRTTPVADGRIGVCAGNGDGTFAAAVLHPSPSPGARLTLGDFDGDGARDVVTRANLDPYTALVSLFRNLGGGILAPATECPTGTGTGVGLAAADLDGDGRADLLAPSRYAAVALHPGQADGAFDHSLSFSSGMAPRPLTGGPRFVRADDVDGDGHPDAVSISGAQDSLTVLLGDGQAGFGAPIRTPIHPGGTGDLRLADLDADGHLDAVTADNHDGSGSPDSTVSVFLGVGDGTFGPRAVFPCGGGQPVRTWLEDVDGDGRPDVLSWNGRVLRGDGAGGLLPAQPIGPGIRIRTVGRIDADPIPDVVASNAGGDSTLILLGLGDGTFAPAFAMGSSSDLSAALGDLDGDGDADLALEYGAPGSGWFSGGIRLMRGAGDGTFTHIADFVPRLLTGDLTLADLDDDGRLDLVFLDGLLGVTALRGDGAGGFEPAYVDHGTGGYAPYWALADFDGDGLLDVVAGDQGLGTVNLLLNGSTPPASVDPPPASGPRRMLAGVVPNPARAGALRVAFTLAGRAPARLEAFDLAGRRVAAREVGALGPGEHRVSLAPTGRLAPGLYLVRLRCGPRVETARAIVLD